MGAGAAETAPVQPSVWDSVAISAPAHTQARNFGSGIRRFRAAVTRVRNMLLLRVLWSRSMSVMNATASRSRPILRRRLTVQAQVCRQYFYAAARNGLFSHVKRQESKLVYTRAAVERGFHASLRRQAMQATASAGFVLV